jgi:predicted nucleic acid-binding protein
MKAVCVDACFLIALYDQGDPYHHRALRYYNENLDLETRPSDFLVPWPILYESTSTRMVRSQWKVAAMRSHWQKLERQRRLILVDDTPYRESALRQCFDEADKSRQHYRSLSLVDRVIRNMLMDSSLAHQIEAFITFNVPDFHDVCRAFPCVAPD